ncbi:hypothetical protein Bbelb_048070 [Branchiostoma belcheri]|nr:hypothetical protein Bbelb_048070 [Branchiostoma belcheri]
MTPRAPRLPTAGMQDAGQQEVRPAVPQQQGIRLPAPYSAVCDNRSSRTCRSRHQTIGGQRRHGPQKTTTQFPPLQRAPLPQQHQQDIRHLALQHLQSAQQPALQH